VTFLDYLAIVAARTPEKKATPKSLMHAEILISRQGSLNEELRSNGERTAWLKANIRMHRQILSFMHFVVVVVAGYYCHWWVF